MSALGARKGRREGGNEGGGNEGEKAEENECFTHVPGPLALSTRKQAGREEKRL